MDAPQATTTTTTTVTATTTAATGYVERPLPQDIQAFAIDWLNTHQGIQMGFDVIRNNYANVAIETVWESFKPLIDDFTVTAINVADDNISFELTPENKKNVKQKVRTIEDPIIAHCYQEVETSERNGISAKDIGFKTGYFKTAVDGALLTLGEMGVIKSFRPGNVRNKRMYIVSYLDPIITFNAFQANTTVDFDRNFIEAVRMVCLKALDPSGKIGMRASDITAYVAETKVVKQTLNESDIVPILETLLSEGELWDSSSPDDEDVLYTINKTRIVADYGNGINETPCGDCPVYDKCTISGPINPTNCQYMTDWLW